MAPKKLNPITEKLLQLIYSQKKITIPSMRLPLTKELMCVLTGIKYPTFDNVFASKRPTVSYATLKGLVSAGIVTSKDEEAYREWLTDNDPKTKRRKRQGVSDENRLQGSFDQFEDEAEGDEGPFGPEVSDTSGADESDSVFPEDGTDPV